MFIDTEDYFSFFLDSLNVNSFVKTNIIPTSYIYQYKVDYKKLRAYFASTETIIKEKYKEKLLKKTIEEVKQKTKII